MNATSVSPAEPAPPRRVLIWDAPVRVFHWLMVFSFAGAWLTAESERWRLLHVSLGYTMAGLVAFRIVWGFIGPRTARFASFVRGPKAVVAYLKALLHGRPEHHSGHNPAGALAIVGLLALTVGVTGTGWMQFNDIGGGGEWLEEAHELLANTLMALVAVHVAGVLLASRLHHENLVAAMFTGCKSVAAGARPEEALRSAWRSVAVLMALAVAGFWWTQWQSAPRASAEPHATASSAGSSTSATLAPIPQPQSKHHAHPAG